MVRFRTTAAPAAAAIAAMTLAGCTPAAVSDEPDPTRSAKTGHAAPIPAAGFDEFLAGHENTEGVARPAFPQPGDADFVQGGGGVSLPPAHSDDDQLYMGTVAGFPYSAPEGFRFPEHMPAVQHPTVTAVDAPGDVVAFATFRCAVVDQAWRLTEAGDVDAASGALGQAVQITDDQLPGNGDWYESALSLTLDGNVEAEAALCQNWTR